MESIDDVIREALVNPEAVVDVPGDSDARELEPLSDSDAIDLDFSSDTDALDLEPVVPPSAGDEHESDGSLDLLTKRDAQAQRKARTERIRRQDIDRYNAFLRKHLVPNRSTFKDIRGELKKLVKKRKDGAQVVLADLNRKHPRIKLRL